MADINKIISEIGAALKKLENGDKTGVADMRKALKKAESAGIPKSVIDESRRELERWGK